MNRQLTEQEVEEIIQMQKRFAELYFETQLLALRYDCVHMDTLDGLAPVSEWVFEERSDDGTNDFPYKASVTIGGTRFIALLTTEQYQKILATLEPERQAYLASLPVDNQP